MIKNSHNIHITHNKQQTIHIITQIHNNNNQTNAENIILKVPKHYSIIKNTTYNTNMTIKFKKDEKKYCQSMLQSPSGRPLFDTFFSFFFIFFFNFKFFFHFFSNFFSNHRISATVTSHTLFKHTINLTFFILIYSKFTNNQINIITTITILTNILLHLLQKY